MIEFRGDKWFLSNFYQHPIDHKGVTYPSVEYAYATLKLANVDDRSRVLGCKTPGQAKRLARSLPMRSDWEDVKVEVMRVLLEIKFADPHLRQLLLNTPLPIVERNEWHDTFWGVCTCSRCNGRGRNTLGRLLMEIRAYKV